MAFDVVKKKETRGDWCCGIGDEDDVIGIEVKLKDKEALFAKIDDVRYDLRKAGSLAGASMAALAGAVSMLGIAHLWNAARGRT